MSQDTGTFTTILVTEVLSNHSSTQNRNNATRRSLYNKPFQTAVHHGEIYCCTHMGNETFIIPPLIVTIQYSGKKVDTLVTYPTQPWVAQLDKALGIWNCFRCHELTAIHGALPCSQGELLVSRSYLTAGQETDTQQSAVLLTATQHISSKQQPNNSRHLSWRSPNLRKSYKLHDNWVRLQVLTAASMKRTAF
jgi:hypothetical protein